MTPTPQSPQAVTEAVAFPPLDCDTMLSLLGVKEREGFESRMRAYETKIGQAPAQRWQRLVCVLMALSPRPASTSKQQGVSGVGGGGMHVPSLVKLSGGYGVQFFIPDGRYRKQVFALNGLANGAVAVYVPDVLDAAVASGLLAKVSGEAKPPPGGGGRTAIYRVAASEELLSIDLLDGRTPDPDIVFKHMTGWNRKAVRITLPAHASEAQVAVVERLCTMAAMEWLAPKGGREPCR